MKSTSSGLVPTLGFAALAIYGIGDVLGAGIYAVIGSIAQHAGTWTWFSFAVALLIAFPTALSYAELGSRFPKSGGAAYYVEEAFQSKSLSFVTGWLVFLTTLFSMATLSRAFVGYLGTLGLQVSEWVLIVGFHVVMALINLKGIRESSVANSIATFVEVSGLLVVLWFGYSFLLNAPAEKLDAETLSTTFDLQKILAGAALAFYAFIGFEDLVNIAEEVKNPRKDIPRAIAVALIVAGTIYIVVAWVAVSVVPMEVLTQSKFPLVEVVKIAEPAFPIMVFSVVALFAVSNTSLLNYVTGSRLLFGLAEQKLLPAVLMKTHSKFHTPYMAIALIFPVIVAMSLIGNLGSLASATSTLILIVFCLANISLIKVKRKQKKTEGFKVPYALPFIAVVFNVLILFFASKQSLIMAAILGALGAVVGWLRFRNSAR